MNKIFCEFFEIEREGYEGCKNCAENRDRGIDRLELFKKWKSLQMEIDSLAGIVQNDIEVTEEMIKDWEDKSDEVSKELDDLYWKTKKLPFR